MAVMSSTIHVIYYMAIVYSLYVSGICLPKNPVKSERLVNAGQHYIYSDYDTFAKEIYGFCHISCSQFL